ncbi:nuclear factor of activated T-cells 5-like isoform X2 [Panonychus citri]|uniref:nuclear factor of activated T-cells 5-like isoform X2 n=1 Tax=Panonychus citri TaxID=50023 RepID=UPI0023073166|nr:nuclear factor of activated T-cells 5-like isoform X2 [Panonychus citri]
MTRIAGNYPSRSQNGKIELRILNQPEEQHRARYLTEGSRGSIKDGTGLGHPVVKLFGFNGCTVKLQCFIGHDKHIGVPHLFYQASRITGKNSTRCSFQKVEGTAVITLDLVPENNMQTTIDCIGILKERNVDVEQKVLRLKSSNGIYNNNGETVSFPSKKRCAKCRLVFRCKIPGTNEILQAVSTPILCTQPVGTPEICKISLSECKMTGGKELYIIGKNFLKDSKVIFKSDNWGKIIEPDKEYLHSSHLICTIPPYDGPNASLPGYFTISISVRSGVNSLLQRSLPLNHSNDNMINQHHQQTQLQQHHQQQQSLSISAQPPQQQQQQQQQQPQQQQQQQQQYGNQNNINDNGIGQYTTDMMMLPSKHEAGFLSHSGGQLGSMIDNIKQESIITTPGIDTTVGITVTPMGQVGKTLLGVPTGLSSMDISGHYYSEDTFLSSDSSAISETILGSSEDSSFSFLFPPF